MKAFDEIEARKANEKRAERLNEKMITSKKISELLLDQYLKRDLKERKTKSTNKR
jgi:hypothetical protein